VSSAAFATKESKATASKGKATIKSGSGGLRIGAPDDAFEREADRVADQIMAGGPMQRNWSLSGVGIGAPLQRKCSCGGSDRGSGECEECKKEGKEEAKTLQRKATSSAGPEFAPPIVNEVLNSPGQPLDKATRDFFEPRFGYDFSKVRVHQDEKSQQSATSVEANAYATGNNVVFGKSAYRPQTHEGRLIAHELAHVIQQSESRVSHRQIGLHATTYPLMRSGPALQRQQAKSTCVTDKTEGQGANFSRPVIGPQQQQWIYGIWGKYNQGEDFISFITRTYTRWIDWRFGKLPADRKGKVQDFLTELSWVKSDATPAPGCFYWVGLTADIYSKTRVLAGEAQEAPQPSPDESEAPLYHALAGNHGTKASSSGIEESTKAERGAPLAHDWSVLDKNEPLARQYLRWMQHFAGLPKSSRADELAANGFTGDELNEIIGVDARYTYYTDLITQGYAEFMASGGKDLDSFNPLMELVLQQFTWGNPTATRNLLRIGKGDSWVPEEKGKLGVAHRSSGLLLYDETGAPLRSISGQQWRDPGYVGAKQSSWGINIADIKDPALFGILNMLRQNIGDPQRQVAQAAQVLYENIDLVKPRVINGLTPEVLEKFKDALPMFVGFLAGQGLAQLLVMSANPYLVAVGGVLKGLLAAAGYIMDIDFAASAIDRLLLVARYLSRVTRDDSGALTSLSEHYLDIAAVPLRDMVADIALLTTMAAFGRLMGAIGGRGKERPRIECHSCLVEPKTGEAKPTEAAKSTESAKRANEPADSSLGEKAATTKETHSTILQEIQDLTNRIAELRKEQAAGSTPERAKAIKAMEAELKELGQEAKQYQDKQAKEDEQIRQSNLSLYDKIRAATPSGKATELVLKRALGLDQYSGKPSPRLTVDHLVPVKDIVNMEGFDKLTWEQQKSVVDMADNLVAMDGPANSSKGSRSWSEWTQWSDYYTDPKIKNDMVARDAALRTKMQAEIARLTK
jgi:hypothetical protein